MSVSITGERSELGRLLARQRAPGRIHFNVAGQHANTLLHDGHAWVEDRAGGGASFRVLLPAG